MTADAVTSGAGGAVRTTCPYCGVGCGVLARPLPDGSVEISGDPDHPANFGRLCSKGTALGETLSLDDRLLTPTIGGKTADWNSALGLVARTFSWTIAEHGPDSVAFYVSGQLLTELRAQFAHLAGVGQAVITFGLVLISLHAAQRGAVGEQCCCFTDTRAGTRAGPRA